MGWQSPARSGFRWTIHLGKTTMDSKSSFFGVGDVGAKAIKQVLPEDRLEIKIAGVVAIILALVLFERKIKSLKKQFLAEEAAQQSLSDSNEGTGEQS